MVKITILSFLLWILTSLIIALGFLLISFNTFMIVFGAVAGLLLFIGYPINKSIDIKEQQLKISSKLLSEQELYIATSLTANVECAYCGTMNSVPININNDYRFKCRDCKQITKVVVNTTSCRTTDLNIEVNEDIIDE